MSSILGNTTGMIRLKVMHEGLAPDVKRQRQDFLDYLLDRIRIWKFKSIMDTIDEESSGWVSIYDQTDTNFNSQFDIHIGHQFIALRIRTDTRKIPPAILKEELDKAEAEWLYKRTLTHVPKQVKEELKEAVKKRLLARTLPTPTINDFIWNIDTGEAWYSNTGKKGLEILLKLWKQTADEFKLHFIPPYEIAHRLTASDIQLQIDLELANQSGSEAVLDVIKGNVWLGQDFLLWTLYQASQEDAPEDSSTWINDRVTVVGYTEEGEVSITFAGPQGRIGELKHAIRTGKVITTATIHLHRNEDGSEYVVTLDGETFAMNGFKTPPVVIEQVEDEHQVTEREAVFLEAMALKQMGIRLLETEFYRFLRRRLTPEWIEVRTRIQAWIEED